MKLLITGCGRSGTQYASRVLTAVGLDVGHEKMGTHGTVDWHRVDGRDKFDIILHQVRHPIRAIESLRVIRGSSWNFITRAEPKVIRSDPVLLRAMAYWAYWNERAEKMASHTYQAEHMIDELGRMVKPFGVRLKPHHMKAVRAVSKTTHTRRQDQRVGGREPLTSAHLVRENKALGRKILTMAERYGYVI